MSRLAARLRRPHGNIPKCPHCRGESIVVTGPVQIVKWIEKVPAACHRCGKTWLSENKRLVQSAA